MPQRTKPSKASLSLEARAFVDLFRTCSTFVAQLNDTLRVVDISQPQYNVLRILRGAGAAGLPSGEIGERMVNRDPDVTRLLDRMEARGLVSRARDSADRRVITVYLSDLGREVVDSLDAPIQALHEQQFAHLSKSDLKTLDELLTRARGDEPA
jgi:DNA-binding MarR family transcriptional regulator